MKLTNKSPLKKIVSNALVIHHLKQKVLNRDILLKQKDETIKALKRLNSGRL